MSKVSISFQTSEAQYEEQDGHPAPVPANQPDSLYLGEFDIDFVQLTYSWLRIGPDGDHIAVLDNSGFWRLEQDGIKLAEQNGNWTDYAYGAGLFTDIGIGVEDSE